MTLRMRACASLLLVAVVLPVRAADSYSIKTVDTAPPKELAEPIRKLLSNHAVQFLDAKGNPLAEVWFRKDIPATATDAQIKNGLTYKELAETTLVGAIRWVKEGSDYRKQKVPPGVYTLRLAFQPMNGDHMGTAPYSEFLLASPAADDKKPDTMEPKTLFELSAKTTENHAAVFLLFPGKGAGATPKLVNKGTGHWVLLTPLELNVRGKKVTFPIGLTLIGASSSA